MRQVSSLPSSNFLCQPITYPVALTVRGLSAALVGLGFGSKHPLSCLTDRQLPELALLWLELSHLVFLRWERWVEPSTLR